MDTKMSSPIIPGLKSNRVFQNTLNFPMVKYRVRSSDTNRTTNCINVDYKSFEQIHSTCSFMHLEQITQTQSISTTEQIGKKCYKKCYTFTQYCALLNDSELVMSYTTIAAPAPR